MFFNQSDFGSRVRKCRKLAEITQEELANRIGVDRNHVSRIERGQPEGLPAPHLRFLRAAYASL